MKNTIENNRQLWDRDYQWLKDGDEWDGQAACCNLPYESWKKSLVDHLILPNISETDTVLEIAPGHGRWSRIIAPQVKKLILVDLGQQCIDFCKTLFKDTTHIDFIVNDGKTITGVPDNSVDFVWSYDSFVHMDGAVISSYLHEISRVLKPGGKSVIHHAGRKHWWLWLGFLRNAGEIGKQIYKVISLGRFKDHDGWRSNVSPVKVRNLAKLAGLEITDQFQFWDQEHLTGVPRFNDCITVIRK